MIEKCDNSILPFSTNAVLNTEINGYSINTNMDNNISNINNLSIISKNLFGIFIPFQSMVI